MDSVSEADNIYVLDTGSTDKTVEKLRQRGAIVKKELIFNFHKINHLNKNYY